MTFFWVLVGMLLWAIASMLTAGLVLPLWLEGRRAEAVAALMFCVLSTSGIVTTVVTNGWMTDTLPADGCYRVARHGSIEPIGTVPVRVDDIDFIPIRCA